MNTIKIRTGANISNILQSTITYAQAFTELAKNSIQNGATNINIQLNKESIVFQDDGVGFDDSIDTNGLSGFDKYFVFGNSYDFSGGAGPRLGHMGIGGKIANDKLSDSDNVHWTIETKNKKGNSYLVTYKPNNSEFLDDYSPTIEKLNNSRLLKSGTIITIKNLDKPITENGLNRESVEKELQDFFGHLIKNGKTEIDIILNGESIKFDYTLIGYAFEKMTERFSYILNKQEKSANVSFNLALLQNQNEINQSTLDGVFVVSETKIHKLSINDVFGSTSNKVSNLFSKLRGFVVCEELSTILDHVGMPAKDLSHHSLREDHPLTKPFYAKVSKIIQGLLTAYHEVKTKKIKPTAINNTLEDVVQMIVGNLNLASSDMMIDLGPKKQEPSAKEKMQKKNVPTKIIDSVIQKEVDVIINKPHKRRQRQRAANEVKQNLTKKTDNAPKTENKPKLIRPSIKYEIKPFGNGLKNTMADLETEGDFCVYINSENPKYISLDKTENKLGLALHIAENIIGEMMRYNNPNTTHSEITEKMSEFYEKNFDKIKV